MRAVTRGFARFGIIPAVFALLAGAAVDPVSAASATDEPVIGVLVLAHGGLPEWNATVRQTVEQARLGQPTEIAFGMGMHADEVQALQQAVDRLERQGVERIIAVPLLISSASEVMRQLAYLLRLRDHGPWEAQTRPVTLRVPIQLTRPLDGAPAVAAILLARARDLSRSPPREMVLLVGHGPNTEEDNAEWLRMMGRLAAQVQQHGGFRAVVPVTMRDDAPPPLQEEATRRMRALVEEYSRSARVLVVPLLLSRGGVESKIAQRLNGLPYAFTGRTLLPDERVAQWIAAQVDTAIRANQNAARWSGPGERRAPVARAGSL